MSRVADFLKELKDMKTSVEKVENIVEKRLIGVEAPSKDEIRAIREHEKLKKKGKAEYLPLKEALKSIGVSGTSRKEGH